MTALSRALLRRQEVQLAASSQERIGRLYQLVYNREPTSEEVATGLRFVERLEADGESLADKDATADDGAHLSRWERYSQVLLMANEFMFVE